MRRQANTQAGFYVRRGPGHLQSNINIDQLRAAFDYMPSAADRKAAENGAGIKKGDSISERGKS